MSKGDQNGNRDSEKQQRCLRLQAGDRNEHGDTKRSDDGGQPHEAEQHHHHEPHRQDQGEQHRFYPEHHSDERSDAFATSKAKPQRVDVAENGGQPAGHRQPLAQHRGVDAAAQTRTREPQALQRQRRNDPRCDDAFADVDEHDPQRKRLALGTQCVRAAGIAAAERADIHAATQPPHDETADERANEIARENLE